MEGLLIELFHFDVNVGRTIEAYGSHFTLNAIGHLENESHIILMSLSEGDVVGRHVAPIPQLFIVMEGCGWVTGENGQKTPITSGEAAYWTKGETHGAGTEKHMKALVIESESLDPSRFMAVRKEL